MVVVSPRPSCLQDRTGLTIAGYDGQHARYTLDAVRLDECLPRFNAYDALSAAADACMQASMASYLGIHADHAVDGDGLHTGYMRGIHVEAQPCNELITWVPPHGMFSVSYSSSTAAAAVLPVTWYCHEDLR